MQLTAAQKTSIKSHVAANTNITPATAADGTTLPTPFVVNTYSVNAQDAEKERAIAEWYNLTAGAGDNQAFANRLVWNPITSLRQINTAWDPTADPVGATAADQTNNWLRWQTMCWAGTNLDAPCLDMSDPQIQAGVVKVWGDTSTSSANKIGKSPCGQRTGTNLELKLSAAPSGVTGGGALANAHAVQKDAGGSVIYGQKLTADMVHDLLLNG